MITVADQAADARGLWPVDFDLLSRMPGLERIDIVATEAVLARRLARAAARCDAGSRRAPRGRGVRGAAFSRPRRPPPGRTGRRGLRRAATAKKSWSRPPGGSSGGHRDRARPSRLERVGVVFQRPLPYLYLARQVFSSARIPYQAADALPLAAEPFAAALDLLFVVAAEDASRASLIALLASPHWRFHDPTQPGRSRSSGSRCRRSIGCCRTRNFSAAGTSWRGCQDWRAARLARTVATARPLGGGRLKWRWRRRSALAPLVRAHQAGILGVAADHGSARFRGALRGTTAPGVRPVRTPYAGAHRGARRAGRPARRARRYDDRPQPIAELVATVHRWIEAQTFAPRAGTDGVRLLDADAAAFARLDDVHLVGLVESDWPERAAPTFSIRCRCCAISPGRRTPIGWPRPARDSPTCWRWPVSASRCRRSRSKRIDCAAVAVSRGRRRAQGSTIERAETGASVAHLRARSAVAVAGRGPRSPRGDASAWLSLRTTRLVSGGHALSRHGRCACRHACTR